MSQDKSVQYTIGVKGEGLERLAKLTSGLDSASAQAAQLKEEAAKVSQQLAAVGQQQQAVDITLHRPLVFAPRFRRAHRPF